MRIDLNECPQPFAETEVSSPKGLIGAYRASASNTSAGEDQAELPRVQAQVWALVAQAAQLPEVRQERVHALRRAIQSGLYCPGHAKVAGAIFEHMITGPGA
jgi:anti-sigma28 factor (negative regulator of flagellin synthesis)